MPISMDRHDMHGATAENVAEAHRRDLEIQDRYGVKYLTYWYDRTRCTGFCLVDAPDAATATVSIAKRTAGSRTPSFRSISLRSRRPSVASAIRVLYRMVRPRIWMADSEP